MAWIICGSESTPAGDGSFVFASLFAFLHGHMDEHLDRLRFFSLFFHVACHFPCIMLVMIHGRILFSVSLFLGIIDIDLVLTSDVKDVSYVIVSATRFFPLGAAATDSLFRRIMISLTTAKIISTVLDVQGYVSSIYILNVH